jgi:hypothetical protein
VSLEEEVKKCWAAEALKKGRALWPEEQVEWRAAVVNGKKWVANTRIEDLVGKADLLLFPSPELSLVISEAVGQRLEPIDNLKRKVTFISKLQKGSVEVWRRVYQAFESVYKDFQNDQSGIVSTTGVSFFLTNSQKEEHTRRQLGWTGTTSRAMELATREFGDYAAMNRRVEELDKLGYGAQGVTMMYGFLKELQKARQEFYYSPSLAFWRCSMIREEAVRERMGGFEAMRSAGLVGVGGGVLGSQAGLMEQFRKVAEGVFKKARVGGAVSNNTTSNNSNNMHGAGMLREVEAYPDGRAIITRAGAVWKGSTCRCCAEANRWPGHHPNECLNGGGAAGGATGLLALTGGAGGN